ncbi:cuticle protein 16.8-like [Argiope bruennichi]|uniref:cuticle protein 16.8-like n=1 Tax=Argiope bruennichi TaxID=94029 RepID=UPI002495747E|nr:cuticle protein 16.8-like [Argiope bruennichi]
MIFITLLLIVLAAVNGQRSTSSYHHTPNNIEGPRLYSFNYRTLLKDGVGESSRSESADGTGKIQGSYSLNNAEGHYRIVEYIADEDGFRAVIRTNEPGTSRRNPANVVMQPESGPFEYNPVVRRPAADEPVPPNIKPATTPESIRVPDRRPMYRRPAVYSGRNPRVNVASESDLDQNIPINRRPAVNSGEEPIVPKLESVDVPADDLISILPIL